MLEIARLSARLIFSTQVTFPYWMGNTFRGGFGIQLRPKPIVFIPPFFGKSFTIQEKGFLDIGILLFGRFIRYLPHVALGLTMLGQNGIGSERRYDVNKFKLEEMRCNFSKEVVYGGSVINIGAMKTVDLADYAREGLQFIDKFSIGFETPIMVKTGEFPPALDKLIGMVRQRLILYVNEYGDGAKRDFHTYTGTAEYAIEKINENAMQLLRIGLLIGAGPKPSFGLGFFQFICVHQFNILLMVMRDTINAISRSEVNSFCQFQNTYQYASTYNVYQILFFSILFHNKINKDEG